MYVAHLHLTDFRSYPHVELALDPGITAFVGPNGQGKTNLVEAVGYVATLSSHRVPTDAAMVRAGTARAVVGTKVVRELEPGRPRATVVEVEITPGKANRARVNGGSPVRARDVLGILRTVLFAPEDLALVKGDPDGRRRFLDELLVQLVPRTAATVADYERVLRQRSALLKSAAAAARNRQGADLRTLDVWDGKLAQLGARIVVERRRLVAALAPLVAEAYEQVSAGQGAAVITYRASLDSALEDQSPAPLDAPAELVEAQLLEAMGRLRPKEIERGVCLVGPHRDDLVLTLADLPAKGYASHGESWSFALALRLASWRVLTEGAGHEGPDDEPVLILDDVFAELDARRRERLATLVAPARQVLITAAVAQDVPEPLAGARVDVMGGEVARVL
ncbi:MULTISPECIES: DNA replication/repair protein RecF [Cellulomonas]|uniref:DNA replication and repair protein RecF n=1 Tax=Cellulomonas gilvus (strain ATCC 13127 / NRRL B-14078) TaxID=593907 RepID=F8A1L7_CELGA|nr:MULTISPECIES: DNA replication/repair protein RecF [Cellulomonas]AEI10538.1 DNA replication and repair protein RecF [Cellulomonas gilvus ATCC 13127]MCR6688546.1 DNA replication/repair protein RecF [Cellulomonas sp.]